MKEINKLIFPVFSIVLFGLLLSCKSERAGFVNHQSPYFSVKENPLGISYSGRKITSPENIEAAVKEVPGIVILEPEKIIVVSNHTPVITQTPKSPVIIAEKSKENIMSGPIKKLSKVEKKEIRQVLKNNDTERANVVGKALLIIFAIILPPLAVALVDGLTGPFWLDLLLTIIFYVPGLIYALYRVLRTS